MIYITIYAILVTIFLLIVGYEYSELESELKMEKLSKDFWFKRAKTESDLADEYSDEIDSLREDVEYYHQLLKDFGYELDDNWNWVKAKSVKTKTNKK